MDEIRLPEGHDTEFPCPFCGGTIRATFTIEGVPDGTWLCLGCMVASGRGFGCSGGLDEFDERPHLKIVD